MSKTTVDYVAKVIVPDVYTKIRALEIRVGQLEKKVPLDTYCLESW